MRQATKNTIVMMTLALGLTACQNNQFQTLDLVESASQGEPAPQGGGFTVHFRTPVAGVVPAQTFAAQIEVSDINKLMTLQLFINGTVVKNFTRLPFEMAVDPNNYAGDITLKAQAKDLSGKDYSAELKLTRGGTSTETPPSSKTAGSFDSNCMNNSAFDACLFWKNPVAHKGSAFSSVLRFGTDLSAVQTFGVKLNGLSSPNQLANSSFRVTVDGGQEAAPQGGSWRFPYQSDSNHFNAQLMAYFWLNHQITETTRRTGRFYAKDKNITVYAYTEQVRDNAYWDGGSNEIVMGYASSGGSAAHEMALGSEVYLHEMGHANLQYAVGGYSNIAPNPAYQSGHRCLSASGCIGGINEGQADFHFLMIFHDSVPLGETWVNRIGGLTSRDVRLNQGMTASSAYSSSGGEVHTIGALYAAILWDIYTKPSVNRVEFEKIFMQHLTMLTGSSRFAEAKSALLAVDNSMFSGKYQSIINTAFSQRGL